MGESGAIRQRFGLEQLALVTAVGIALVGGVALMGWVLHMPVLAAWTPGTVPMAPSTAVLCLLLGIGFALCDESRSSATQRRAALALTLAAGLVAGALLALRLLNLQFAAERLWLTGPAFDTRTATGTISLPAAAGFLLASASMLLLRWNESLTLLRAGLAAGGGGVLTLVGSVFLAAHVFGSPLISADWWIPPAFNTSLVLGALGGLLLACVARALAMLQPASSTTYSDRHLVTVGVAISVVIVLGGYAYYRSEERTHLRSAESSLESLARLKVNQLTQWRRERMGDATVLDASLSDEEVEALVTPQGQVPSATVLRWLKGYEAYGQYDRIDVLDADGNRLLSAPSREAPLARAVLAATPGAAQSGQATLVDFFLDEGDGQVRLTLLVPVNRMVAGHRRSVVVALRINPDAYLFPKVLDWPTSSRTGESFLVRRQGHEVMFLSRLRRDPEAPLRRRFSLDRRELVTVRAALGDTGLVRGADSRGTGVVAYLLQVPGTSWTLLARMEQAEISEELQMEVLIVTGFVVLLLAMSSVGVWVVWLEQLTRQAERMATLTQTLREQEGRLRLALTAGSHGLWELDLDTKACIFSPEYALMLGYDPATFTLTRESFAKSLHPDDRETTLASFQELIDNRKQTFRAQFRQCTRTGGWIWILSQGSISARNESGQPLRLSGLNSDITSLKAAEQRSLRFAQMYATVSDCQRAIARSSNVEELFPLICEASVKSGGMALAWVGLVDVATGVVTPVASAGDGASYLAGIQITVNADDQSGRGPTGTAIREGHPVWVEDFPTNPLMAPWRERGAVQGWQASVALPLQQDGRTIGALMIYTRNINAFDADDRRLLMELMESINIALDRLRARHLRAEAEAALQFSEARYRALFTDSSVTMLVIDPETGCVIEANPAACAYYGWPHETLVGLHLSTLNMLSPEEVEARAHAIQRDGRQALRLRHRLASGELRDVEIFSSSLQLDGKPRLLSVIVDVTARVQAEAAVQESLTEKEALLKEVHHRVKNNLQVITSLLRLESGRTGEGLVRAVLADMQNRILAMALLHETLYRSGTLARVDLSVYLSQLANQMFRAAAPGLSVTLGLDLASVMVDMDTAIPCGLLVNELVSNALKHAFPDGRLGEIRLTLATTGGSGGLRLSVSDTGVGLPEDFEQRRTHSLGLQLVTSLTRQLGGTLDIGQGPGGHFSLNFTLRASSVAGRS